MSVVIKINSVDRSSWIDRDSIVYQQGLTKEPDTLEFMVLETPDKTVPSLSDAIELHVDSTKLFSGKIVETEEVLRGGLLHAHMYRCKDYTFDLDKTMVAKSYSNQTAEQIIDDIISTFTTGFTSVGVASGTPTINSIKFNYEPVSRCIQRIADIINWDWYVDEDKDIRFFDETSYTAPHEINDTDGNLIFRSLNFKRNILELRNSIYIRGGEYKQTYVSGDTPDKYDADGTQRVFSCIYRYSDISVTVAGVSKTVGIDNVNDPTAFDCLYNFQEKAVKFPDASKPTVGQEVKIFGEAHIPLITQIKDHSSVTEYGEYQDVKRDDSIISIEEAFSLGKSEINRWAEGSYEGSFRTRTTGWRTGQQVRINSTEFGIDKFFKINRLEGRMITPTEMEFTIYFIASGNIGFVDIMVGVLTKDLQNLNVTDSQILQRLQVVVENVNVAESVSMSSFTGPYNWATDANPLVWSLRPWG